MMLRALLIVTSTFAIAACNRTAGPASTTADDSESSMSGTTTNTDSGSHPENQPAPNRTPAPKGTPGEEPLPKKSTKMK